MSWQDDLKQLDSELSEGKISIEEHRKRRDSLLAAASSTATTTKASAQPAQPQSAPQQPMIHQQATQQGAPVDPAAQQPTFQQPAFQPPAAQQAEPPQAVQPPAPQGQQATPQQATPQEASAQQAAPQQPEVQQQPEGQQQPEVQQQPAAQQPWAQEAAAGQAVSAQAVEQTAQPEAQQVEQQSPQQAAEQPAPEQPAAQQPVAQQAAAEPAAAQQQPSSQPEPQQSETPQPEQQPQSLQVPPAAAQTVAAQPIQPDVTQQVSQHQPEATQSVPPPHAAQTQTVFPESAAERTSVVRPGAVPPEAPAEQTQWVARNPAQPTFGDQPERTQSIRPTWETGAERTQQVPRVPPGGGYPQQQGPPPYSPLASGLQQNRGGVRPGANAGEAWQPNWHREWEPGPGGAPFDPFGIPQPEPADSFAAEPKKPSLFANKKVLGAITGVLLLVIVGLGLWFFVFSGNSNDQAGPQNPGDTKPKELPADLDAMINALPKLPGVPDAGIGPKIPVSAAAAQGLYPAETADKLNEAGSPEVVYKASTDGAQQYGVLAVRSDDPQGIRADILDQQKQDGWQEAQEPNAPKGATGLQRTADGITFHRVLYTAGKWTIFIGVSPTNTGNDAQVQSQFGDVVKAVNGAVPAK